VLHLRTTIFSPVAAARRSLNFTKPSEPATALRIDVARDGGDGGEDGFCTCWQCFSFGYRNADGLRDYWKFVQE
jgi:hypothetical protein